MKVLLRQREYVEVRRRLLCVVLNLNVAVQLADLQYLI